MAKKFSFRTSFCQISSDRGVVAPSSPPLAPPLYLCTIATFRDGMLMGISWDNRKENGQADWGNGLWARLPSR